MKIQLSPAIEQAVVALIESQRELNEHRMYWMGVQNAYWESQTPRCYRQPRPEAPTGQGKHSTKHQVDIPAMDMGGFRDLFLSGNSIDPDDLPDDRDDDPVPV